MSKGHKAPKRTYTVRVNTTTPEYKKGQWFENCHYDLAQGLFRHVMNAVVAGEIYSTDTYIKEDHADVYEPESDFNNLSYLDIFNSHTISNLPGSENILHKGVQFDTNSFTRVLDWVVYAEHFITQLEEEKTSLLERLPKPAQVTKAEKEALDYVAARTDNSIAATIFKDKLVSTYGTPGLTVRNMPIHTKLDVIRSGAWELEDRTDTVIAKIRQELRNHKVDRDQLIQAVNDFFEKDGVE